MKIKAIITGATGMVGEGVLHECLQHDEVEKVLVLGRKPCGIAHPKLREIIHGDLYDLATIANQLTGFNACFFCLGTSSVGKSETEYYKVFGWLYPFVRAVLPDHISTLKELGLAMIHSVTKGCEKQILEVKDIVALARK